MLSLIIKGLILGFSGGVTPGIFHAFLFTKSLNLGWKRTLPAIFAPLISDGPIIVGILFLLSKIPVEGLHGLKIAGGIFILYLAKNAFAKTSQKMSPDHKHYQNDRVLIEGIILNFLNPAPYIFWSIIGGPILVSAFHESITHGLGFILGLYASLICVFGVFVFLYASARNLKVSTLRNLNILSGSLLGVFGIYQSLSGIIQLCQSSIFSNIF
jgi:threonine/homoserine/homoserine lactone efflux protein